MMMRKTLTIAFTLFLLTTTPAKALSTASWYAYNSSSATHGFTIKFPDDWQIKEVSSKEHILGPEAVTLQEFENFSIEDLIKYYQTSENRFLIQQDRLFSASSQDLLMEELQFSTFRVFALKRGSSIIALKENDPQYSEIFEAILPTITFSDQWHQYIDFKDDYTFTFPRSLKLNLLNEGVSLSKNNQTYFTIKHYAQPPIALKENDKTDLNSYSAYKTADGLLLDYNSQYFQLAFQSFAELDELLDSFYFFNDSNEEKAGYLFFPDVDNYHPNSTAINSLVQDKVINGYADGTFKPNGEINRAELTKMIVASKISPDKTKYKNCFPDVKEQWFAPYICYAKAQGWVQGYDDGNFKPENSINRVEAIKILLEALTTHNFSQKEAISAGLPVDIETKAWYINYFNFAYKHDLLDLNHLVSKQYFPAKEITRKEVAESIFRINQNI